MWSRWWWLSKVMRMQAILRLAFFPQSLWPFVREIAIEYSLQSFSSGVFIHGGEDWVDQ